MDFVYLQGSQPFDDFPIDIVLTVVIMHEMAHAKTGFSHLDTFAKYGNTNFDSRRVEQYADCLTGTLVLAEIRRFTNEEIEQIKLLYSRIGGSEEGTHGSGKNRTDAFAHGLQKGTCDAYIR